MCSCAFVNDSVVVFTEIIVVRFAKLFDLAAIEDTAVPISKATAMVNEMSAQTSIPSGSKSARGNSNAVDRLSSLCDEMLHHVMSFLPMTEVVRTSLLSPRWRNLWAFTPFIHIDQEDFLDDNHFLGWDYKKLKKFGDNLLLLRDGKVCLDEARIFLTNADEWKCYVWIRHAIKHNVRRLHVYGFFETCPDLDSTAMFPSQHLKIIRLQDLTLGRGFFRLLNNDFHVLENLELEDCYLCDPEPEEISSMSLKVLRIIGGMIPDGLLICARNLTHLSIFYTYCCGAIVARDLFSLVTASVILSYMDYHFDNHTIEDGLPGGLSHAATLELRAPLHELAFERGLQACPMFSNLTSLVLGDWCTAADFYPLFYILQRSPKLKELTVKLEMKECHICKNSGSVLASSRGTSSATESYPSIKRIKICCHKDDPRVGALVQALLLIINPDVKISIERC